MILVDTSVWIDYFICLLNNIKLLHNDKDFIPMEKYLHLQTVK